MGCDSMQPYSTIPKFGGPCYSSPWRCRQEDPPKRRYSTSLHLNI